MIRNLCLTVAAALTLHGLAAAAPLTWYVNGNFEDGATVSGSFTFDADSETVSTWSVHVAGGNTTDFPNIVYATNPLGVYYNPFAFPEVQFSFADPNSARALILSTVAPLTNAGGTISLIGFIDGSNFSGECYNCNPYRVMTEGGSLTTTPPQVLEDSSVPEPASISLGLIGAGVILVTRRRTLQL